MRKIASKNQFVKIDDNFLVLYVLKKRQLQIFISQETLIIFSL